MDLARRICYKSRRILKLDYRADLIMRLIHGHYDVNQAAGLFRYVTDRTFVDLEFCDVVRKVNVDGLPYNLRSRLCGMDRVPGLAPAIARLYFTREILYTVAVKVESFSLAGSAVPAVLEVACRGTSSKLVSDSEFFASSMVSEACAMMAS